MPRSSTSSLLLLQLQLAKEEETMKEQKL